MSGGFREGFNAGAKLFLGIIGIGAIIIALLLVGATAGEGLAIFLMIVVIAFFIDPKLLVLPFVIVKAIFKGIVGHKSDEETSEIIEPNESSIKIESFEGFTRLKESKNIAYSDDSSCLLNVSRPFNPDNVRSVDLKGISKVTFFDGEMIFTHKKTFQQETFFCKKEAHKECLDILNKIKSQYDLDFEIKEMPTL